MCDSQVIRRTRPTLPSLLSILKDFPVQQYVQAGHFYHSNSMRVLFSRTQLGPKHEINLRGAGSAVAQVVECLTRDRRAAGSSLTGVTALWSLSKTHLS